MNRLLLLACLALLLPGCVAWEIRDEIRSTNSELGGVHTSLSDTNTRLDKVESGLGRIDATNSSLDTLQQQLELLASIKESLTKLDAHLGSLRKTIGRIDSAIPFLDLGADAPVDAPAAEAVPEVAVTETQPAAPRRDPLLGTWIQNDPAYHDVIVLLADGTFISGGKDTLGRGTWSRGGAVLRFQPAPQARANPDGTTTAHTPDAYTLTILAQTPRSLTLEVNGGIRIYTKP